MKQHGQSVSNNGKRHELYVKWTQMKQRVTNPNHDHYKYYGARGIKICDEWIHNFKAFYDWAIANGWKEGLQIDRIDNDGDYSPENCRFVTQAENQRNRTNNKVIRFYGNSFTLAEWARLLDLKKSILGERLRRGWTVFETLCLPVGYKRNVK